MHARAAAKLAVAFRIVKYERICERKKIWQNIGFCGGCQHDAAYVVQTPEYFLHLFFESEFERFVKFVEHENTRG